MNTLVQVDVKELIKRKITADELTVVQLLLNKDTDTLKKYLNLYTITEKEILFNKLAKSGLVISINPPNEYDPFLMELQPYASIALAQGDFFDEFLNTFPTSTIRPDGIRDYLRTDVNRCKKVYTRITNGKESVHRNIMDCLRCELESRKRFNKMPYMKKLPNWLSSEEWKTWEQQLKDTNPFTERKEDIGYGCKLE